MIKEAYQWIVVFVIIISDWIWLLNVKKSLERPVKVVIVRKLLSKYDDIEKFYRAYKELKQEQFKLAKINLKSLNYDSSFLQQIIDLFSKLIFTIGIAVISVIVTISASTLAYVKDNKELQVSPLIDITKNTENVFLAFNEGLKAYQLMFNISVMLFIIAANHFYLVIHRKKILNMHQTIVDEIAEEYKSTANLTVKNPLSVVPDQSQSAS